LLRPSIARPGQDYRKIIRMLRRCFTALSQLPECSFRPASLAEPELAGHSLDGLASLFLNGVLGVRKYR
jgi:hypothetical protein